MRVLVTGHLGYIGTVLTPMLVKRVTMSSAWIAISIHAVHYSAGGKIHEVPTIRKDTRDVVG